MTLITAPSASAFSFSAAAMAIIRLKAFRFAIASCSFSTTGLILSLAPYFLMGWWHFVAVGEVRVLARGSTFVKNQLGYDARAGLTDHLCSSHLSGPSAENAYTTGTRGFRPRSCCLRARTIRCEAEGVS